MRIKTTKSPRLWLITLLIIFLIGGVGFLLLRSNSFKEGPDLFPSQVSITSTPAHPTSITQTQTPPRLILKPSTKEVPDDWKTYRGEKIGIVVSFPPEFIHKVDNNGDLSISNGSISLSFLPEFQGSPCGNAPCNQFKDVKLTIAGSIFDERLIWPDHKGNISFKEVVPYPKLILVHSGPPPFYLSDISIFGNFPKQEDLVIVNHILSTFRFIDQP